MQTRGEGELDRIVYEHFFPAAPTGVFVDVGAARPDFLSMSALYRELGWRVIAIEPNPVFCEAQRAAGHEVLEYACGDRDEDDVDFEIVDLHGAVYEGGPVSFESFSSLHVSRTPTEHCGRISISGVSRSGYVGWTRFWPSMLPT